VIVLDASALVDAFSSSGGRSLRAADAIRDEELAAPFHFDLEAISGIRRLARTKSMSEADAQFALSSMRRLRISRFRHEPLYPRIWELRENVSIADAAYVALAESLGARLVTSDGRLVRATGPRCEFQLIS
jgi:predicted nucleic acid-binding protein